MLISKINLATHVLSCLVGTTLADAATIRADLQTINRDFENWNTAINNYDGSFGSAMALQQTGAQLDKDVKQAATDVQSSGPISSSDCKTLTNYVSNTLEPDVKSAINALISKKSVVIAYGGSGAASNVCNDLKQLKSDIDNFLSFLKCNPPTVPPGGQTPQGKIDNDFQAGLNAYCS